MKADEGQSETYTCKECGCEYEFFYDHVDKVVAERRCKCNKTTKEKIDSALKVIGEHLKQQGK
jgi:hypothetical protein